MKAIILALTLCNFAHASDLAIKSISITKAQVPEHFKDYVGDYDVTLEVQNTSQRTIQVGKYSKEATEYLCYNFICSANLSDEEVAKSGQSDYYKNNSMSCHPPVYDDIAPNEVFKLRFRDSSKNENKEMLLSITSAKGSIIVGRYTLKLSKG